MDMERRRSGGGTVRDTLCMGSEDTDNKTKDISLNQTIV